MSHTRISPLRVRIVVAVLLVQMALVGVLAMNMSQSWDRVARDSLDKRLQELGLLFNSTLVPTLLSQDYATAFDLMESVRSGKQIEYLVLLDRHGKIVASSGWAAAQPLPPADSLRQIRRLDTTFHAETPLKLADEYYGSLHYGVTTQSLTSSLKEMYWQTLSIALLSVAVSTSLLLWFGMRLTKDLTRLGNAVTSMASGITREKLNIRRNDEIGKLARDFESMSSTIHQQLQDLRESEAKFHAIADYTYGAELWVSPEGKLLWANSSVEHVFGFSVSECMQMHDFPRPLIAGDPEEAMALLRPALQGNSGQDVEFRGLRKDGSEFWCVVSWAPICAADGTFLGVRASARDNSDYRETQSVLSQAVVELQHSQAMQQRYLSEAEQEKARLGALLAAISVGILFVDQRDRIVYCNPAFRHQWQITDSAALIGSHVDEALRQAGNMPDICKIGRASCRERV